MGTDGPDPPPCDDAVYRNGTHVATWPTFEGTNGIEAFVKFIGELSEQRVDWFFCAGRVVVKALGDIERVKRVIQELEPARETLYRLHLKERYHDNPVMLSMLGMEQEGEQR